MAEVKWIKITTDMFDNRKIRHLRRLPEGNNIVLIWVMLLTMAGRCNAGGMIFLTENIPYTPKMLACELGFEESTVQLALQALEQLSMIVTNDGYFAIAGWEEYQNVEGMDKIREQNRLRQKKWYDKQKELPNVKPNVSITLPNATEEDIEEEIKNKKEDKSICQQVVDMYHDICKSFPAVRSLSDARRKSIKARLKDYTMDDFRQVFQNAEASSFLKGLDGGWKASFDWLIKEANMLKVLEGNYADKGWKQKSVMQPSMSMGQAELEAIQRVLSEDY
jgi:predicted phage replisome organizer